MDRTYCYSKVTLLQAATPPPPSWCSESQTEFTEPAKKKLVVFLCCAPNYSQKCVDVGVPVCVCTTFSRQMKVFFLWLLFHPSSKTFPDEKLFPIVIPYDYTCITCTCI